MRTNDVIELLPAHQKEVVRDHQASLRLKIGPLLRDLGVKGELRDLQDGHAGFAFYAPGYSSTGFVVRINRKQSLERQRFTAGHEIGHCLLHPKSVINRSEAKEWWEHETNRAVTFDAREKFSEFQADPFEAIYSTDQTKLEREADRFAAHLLMPARMINKLWRAGYRSEEEMADVLGVSTSAMRFRLKELQRY
ncbi:MAG: ImmA/IrrE family metallo-endopeptidase [Pseudomonadota bacterium]